MLLRKVDGNRTPQKCLNVILKYSGRKITELEITYVRKVTRRFFVQMTNVKIGLVRIEPKRKNSNVVFYMNSSITDIKNNLGRFKA